MTVNERDDIHNRLNRIIRMLETATRETYELQAKIVAIEEREDKDNDTSRD